MDALKRGSGRNLMRKKTTEIMSDIESEDGLWEDSDDEKSKINDYGVRLDATEEDQITGIVSVLKRKSTLGNITPMSPLKKKQKLG